MTVAFLSRLSASMLVFCSLVAFNAVATAHIVSAELQTVAGMKASMQRISAAWHSLETGKPMEAYVSFRRECHLWSSINKQSVGYVDCQRGLVLSALFSKDDATADRLWDELRDTNGESRGDHLVFSGKIDRALITYRDATRDNSISNPHPDKPDPVVAAGVDLALKRHWSDAIAVWSQPSVAGGPYSLDAEQKALVGIGYAVLGEWAKAERAWLTAARTSQVVPQMSELTRGNMTALAMLLHFRKKFVRGEERYSWQASK